MEDRLRQETEYKDTAQSVGNANDRDVLLTDIRDRVAALRADLQQHYNGIGEDRYLARFEAQQGFAFVLHFERAIAGIKPADELDLRRVGIDHGYDPDDVYSCRNLGVEYVPAIERERSQYERDIRRVQPFIDGLEDAGVKVRRAFRELWHDEHDPAIFGSSQESLNRFLDLKAEAPALIGILYDVGIARLTMEERYERIDVERYDLREKADQKLGFLTRLERAISEARPGGVIDMRAIAFGAGDTRDAAAEDLRSDLHSVRAGEDARSIYRTHVASIEKYISRLEQAGVTVVTGFRDEPGKERGLDAAVEQPRSDRSQFEREQRYASRRMETSRNALQGDGAPQDVAAYWAAIAKSSSIGLGRELSRAEARAPRRGRSQ